MSDVDAGSISDARTLETKKANYGPIAGAIALTWMDGVFVPDLPGDDREDRNAKAETGRRFGDAITRKDVHLRGGTSFQSLYTLISMLRANYEAWVQWAESAPDKCPPDVAATFREIRDMYAGSPKTFDGVMAGVSNAWSFMADPRMQETLVDDDLADFPLDVIVKSLHGAAFMVVIIPDELLSPLALVLRALISSLRLIKKEHPEADPVHYLIDEAARFGPFAEIGELMAIGRVAKTVPWLFYQDDAQIARNLIAHQTERSVSMWITISNCWMSLISRTSTRP